MARKRSLVKKRSKRTTQIIQLLVFLFLLLFVIGLRANVGRFTSRLLQSIGATDDVATPESSDKPTAE